MITHPPDGLTLPADAPPLVLIEGKSEARHATTWLVVDNRRIPVNATEGGFRQVVPVLGPRLRLWAEALAEGAPTQRSEAITVHRAGPRATACFLVVEWTDPGVGPHAEVAVAWRARPDRLDAPVQHVTLAAVARWSDGPPVDVFALPGPKPGAYTLTLRHRASTPGMSARAVLYLPGDDGLAARVLGPVSLGPGGGALVARVLLPQGVRWEQEDWFSGKSESVDTVTKFRFPEGISWIERKVELEGTAPGRSRGTWTLGGADRERRAEPDHAAGPEPRPGTGAPAATQRDGPG